jgi:hypothetical protein
MLSLRLLVLASLAACTLPAPGREIVLQRDSADATLIELYSSEGCSSCPPAEGWLSQLVDSPQLWRQVFPVAFHVDYWDGLGWPDRFARGVYTDRQRDYAARLHQDSVYTPEFVVNGQEWRGWFHGEGLPAPQATGGNLKLTVDPEAGTFSADYQPAALAPGAIHTLHACLLGMGIVSDVQRGENGGRELRHDFIVLDFQSRPLSAAPGGHRLLAATKWGQPGQDPPRAVVAWISTPDREVVQIVGGPLN